MPTCLIVDDDELSCEVAAKTIRSLGINAIIETNSMEALLICSTKMPDLILLDMQMPKVDGLYFIKMLKAMKNSSRVKVIASTGMNDIHTVQALKAECIDGYLVKPYSAELLTERVRGLGL